MTSIPKLCPCGQPLHYRTPEAQRVVEEIIETCGETIPVTITGKTWKIPRHYIALHELIGSEVARLGFEEIQLGQRIPNGQTRT